MHQSNKILPAWVVWFAFPLICQFATESRAAGLTEPSVASFTAAAHSAQMNWSRPKSPTRFDVGGGEQLPTVEMYLIIREAEDFYGFNNPLTAAIKKLDLSGVRFTYLSCGYYHSEAVLPGPVATIPLLTKAVHVKVAAADVPKVVAAAGVKTTSRNAVYTDRPEICRREIPRAFDRSYRVAIWAAAVYPEFFPAPLPGYGTTADGYEYFIFGSINFVGVRNGRVYVHNGYNWNYLDVGAVSDFIPESLDAVSAQ